AAALRPGPDLGARSARRAPGPPDTGQAGAHGVPGTPGAGLRDPQVGRRPGPAQPVRVAAGDRAGRQAGHPAPALRLPARTDLVRRRSLPRAGARPRRAVRRPLRRGVPRAQALAAGRCVVSTDIRCRFCGSTNGEVVADLGMQPACDHFPYADAAQTDPVYPLRLWVCRRCHLAQLAEDPTEPDEPRGVEPLALVRQARQAVAAVHAAGLLPSEGVALEHGSPHGGSWLGLLDERGIRPATDPGRPVDVVVDSFGLMHDADQNAALEQRVDELKPDGVLLVQFHSLAAVLRKRQWNAIRHGHPVYLSTPALVGMLARVGLRTVAAWWFDLYGGTVLLAARRQGSISPSVRHLIDDELAAGVEDFGE